MNRNYWIAFLFALAAYLIRTQGALLVAAILIYLLLQRKWKPALVLTAMFSPLFIAFGTGGRYLGILLQKDAYNVAMGRATPYDLLARMTQNFTLYVMKILPEALAPWSAFGGLSAVLGIVIVYVLIKGAKR